MAATKVAIILGVGPGLGSAVAHRFAREGFAVGLVARSEDYLNQLKTEIETVGSAAIAVADVTDPISIQTAFNKLHSELGSTEVLVYNAGAYINAGILELNPEQFEAAWKVNCFGAFLAAQQVLPTMVEQQRGAILLTNATASQKGSARFAALAVGKFGLRALAQSLAREFGPQGIHVVNIVIDGIINTPRTRSMMQERDQHTLLSPDAIAETYWQLYQQDRTAWTLEIDLRPAVEKF